MLSLFFHERLTCSIFGGHTQTTNFLSFRSCFRWGPAVNRILFKSFRVRAPFKLALSWWLEPRTPNQTTVTHVFTIKTSFFSTVEIFFLGTKKIRRGDERRRNRIELYIPLNHSTAQQIRTLLERFFPKMRISRWVFHATQALGRTFSPFNEYLLESFHGKEYKIHEISASVRK